MATEFQQLVWDALKKIPKGKVVTYGELARAVGRPSAVRAVGTACGKNPRLVTVPCHRVVTSAGYVGQYAGGQKKKIALLQKEGVEVHKGNIDLEKYLYAFK